jgi:hypothetical protein
LHSALSWKLTRPDTEHFGARGNQGKTLGRQDEPIPRLKIAQMNDRQLGAQGRLSGVQNLGLGRVEGLRCHNDSWIELATIVSASVED